VQGSLILLFICFLLAQVLNVTASPSSTQIKKYLWTKSGQDILLNKKLGESYKTEVALPIKQNFLEENSNTSSLKDLKSKLRLSNSEKNSYELSEFLRQVLVGKLLGDAHMRKYNISENSKSPGNARIIFLQSLEQSELIYHLYA